MKKVMSILGGLLLMSISVSLQAKDFETYEQYEKEVRLLEDRGKYSEALDLTLSVWEKFPENQFEVTTVLAYLYEKTKQYEKCIETWEYGHKKDYFFLINSRSPQFEPYLKMEKFAAIEAKDKELRAAAISKSRMIYSVDTPTDYDPTKQYPLLIALHGGGSDMANLKKHWVSPGIQKGMVIAYVQSYLHYDLKSFGWGGFDPSAREEIKRCFDEITDKYSIDKTNVVIGGISAGGVAALDFAINKIIPVTGVLGICPGKPKEFDMTAVAEAKSRGLKVVFIGGEEDFYLSKQKEMVELFKKVELPYQFEIIPGMGHGYPEEFSRRIDEALVFLQKK